MNYTDIKTFSERCETHPDHQNGMVTERDIQRRLYEEVEELRAYIEGTKWVGLTDEEKCKIIKKWEMLDRMVGEDVIYVFDVAEQLLKEKNT
jgi:hypothetical protein